MLQQSVLTRFRLFPLTAKHHAEALTLTVHQGLSGGAVCDALPWSEPGPPAVMSC